MDKDTKIYVAGHHGLVGSALVRQLKSQGYHHLLLKSHSELDLTDQNLVKVFFSEEKPEYVFLAAAKVGGIHANSIYPADHIRENINIQQNVIENAYQNNTKRLLFLASSCLYPKDSPQSIKEEYLLTGALEETSRPFAIAKISGIEMCSAYNKQYNTQYLTAISTNLYGPGDNYDVQSSHVLPALIMKFHEAKIQNIDHVELWGTGNPRREFLYSDDMANACIFLMNLPNKQYQALISNENCSSAINIGSGKDISIKELANIIKEIVGYNGKIKWNPQKPDGTLRKLLDISKLNNLSFKPNVGFSEGINLAYHDYING